MNFYRNYNNLNKKLKLHKKNSRRHNETKCRLNKLVNKRMKYLINRSRKNSINSYKMFKKLNFSSLLSIVNKIKYK